MDRIALSIAARPIAQQFGLSPVWMGYLFSSFIWSYTLFQLPMGYLVDRIGSKRMAAYGIFVWSLATALTGAAGSFASILVARLVMGAGESTTNPVIGKIVREWIPTSERGVFASLSGSGSFVGPALASALFGASIGIIGWRWSFVFAGGIGMIWLLAWLYWFDAPETVEWLSAGEREKILNERQEKKDKKRSEGPDEGHNFLHLLSSRTLWGLALTMGCNVYAQYLFLTWLPSYLLATRHLTILKTGLFTAVPYIIAAILCILLGRLSDKYVRREGVISGRRRNVVAAALMLGSVVLIVQLVQSIWVLVAVFAISLSGIATTTTLDFSLLNDLLVDPRNIGKAMAFVVIGGNVFGLMAPIVTGYVIQITGSYNWAFLIAGLLLVSGATIVLTMTRRPIAPKSAGAAGVPEPQHV
jgi:ACS family glucarate transporter-like MFS transporter